MSLQLPALHAVSASSALLKISGLLLVLPQNEIRAIGALPEVDASGAASSSVGWLTHAQRRWPVYCLSAELSLLATVPAERRVCVLLGGEGGCIGVLCDDVGIEQSPGRRHALPPAMALADAPVTGLIELEEGRIACITDSKRLAAHVASLAGA